MKEKFYLCKCTNCESILFDENPQTDTPKLELKGGEKDMVYLEDDGGHFWGCPECKTDDYLIDLVVRK